uniref:Uncharacterized protein n=1 Tax=Branchiostoma floridae TaxID=7739 RepID=C3YLE0_BRAFL|eukprot:XP_002602865.1 hypothetical protein BRAFLDRAFT_103250 [Branchiostoma floridae]
MVPEFCRVAPQTCSIFNDPVGPPDTAPGESGMRTPDPGRRRRKPAGPPSPRRKVSPSALTPRFVLVHRSETRLPSRKRQDARWGCGRAMETPCIRTKGSGGTAPPDNLIDNTGDVDRSRCPGFYK